MILKIITFFRENHILPKVKILLYRDKNPTSYRMYFCSAKIYTNNDTLLKY